MGGLSDKYDKREVFLLTAAFMWTLATIIISLIPEFLIFVIFFGLSSFFGSIAFSLFSNFFSVFYVESGGDLVMLSFSFVISFVLFIGTNYLGEAIIKRYQSNDHDNLDNKRLENNYTNSGKKTLKFLKLGVSERLKKVFILWSILGFSILCILIAIMPQALMVILIVYSLPTIPFFFVSMLALTAKVVKTEEKALAIGIQGVFVFLGRSITIYFGALLLDMGGFQLAAIINVILLIFLLIITLITFKQLNRFSSF